MKKTLNSIAINFVAVTTCIALNGCTTYTLRNSCDEADPRVEAYHAAYEYHGEIVLEYTVENRNDRTFKRMADRYWAELHPVEVGDGNLKGDYTIHRTPLPESKRKQMRELPIVDLRETVSPASDGYMKLQAIFAYINAQPTNEIPQVYRCMGCSSQLYVRYRDPQAMTIGVYETEPYDIFIPASRYPKFILLYPFALIGDILAFPLALLSPTAHWND